MNTDEPQPVPADQHNRSAPTSTSVTDPLEVLKTLWHSETHSLSRRLPSQKYRYLRQHTDPAELFAEAEAINGCVWWGVSPTPGAKSRGETTDVVEARTMFVDLDWSNKEGHASQDLPTEDEVHRVVKEFPIRPTVVLETGGGLQLFWVLDEMLPRVDFERAQELLQAAFEAEGLHAEATDIVHIMRVPGTLNHKYSPPRPVVVAEFNAPSETRHVTVAMFEKRFGHLVAASSESVDEQSSVDLTTTKVPAFGSGLGPAELVGGPYTDFNRTHTIEDLLVEYGWDRNGTHWSRPRRKNGQTGEPELGESAKVESDHRGKMLHVYSTGPELKDLRALGKPTKNPEITMVRAFDLFAFHEHGGDQAAALAAINRSVPTNVNPETGEIVKVPAEARLGWFWWTQTSALTHIAQVADANTISREAVLLSVLANVGTYIPPMLCLPGPPRKGAPNVIMILPAIPGLGKGSAQDAADGILPAQVGVRRTPAGTAEGFVKTFFDPNPDKEERKARPMVQHGSPVMVRINEIGAFAQQVGRSSSGEGLIAQLKQMCSGEQLGFGYADVNKRVIVPPLTYRVQMVCGVAPAKGQPLFDDAGGGLPQRMVFALADPEHIPEDDELDSLPEDPGRLDWENPYRSTTVGSDGYLSHEISVDADVKAEMRRERFAVMRAIKRGEPFDELDTHRVYNRLKVAVLLAYLHGEFSVTTHWHRMAEEVMTCSDATRRWLLAQIAAERARVDAATNRRQVNREVAVAGALSGFERAEQLERTIQGAHKLVDLVDSTRADSVSAARRLMRSYSTAEFHRALEYAFEAGWLVEEEIETTSGGSTKRELRLGEQGASS